MTRYTGIFIDKRDRNSTLKALGISVLASLGFLFVFLCFYKPVTTEQQPVKTGGPTSKPTSSPQPRPAPAPDDPNERYRIVPENFKSIDFNNWTYGRYRFGAEKLTLTLKEGEHEHPWKEGGGGETFSLHDVLFTDVTRDGRSDAVVILWHVQCGGSCDGGSALIYVYENSKMGLRKIWEYETGSLAYGCGFKSLSISKKQIALEMFGQCWRPASSFAGSGKFVIEDVTRSIFRFNGRRFVRRLTEITTVPAQDLKGYKPEVHIVE